jgi:hypothetical protein
MPGSSAAPKRHYNIDPRVAHERARLAARARNAPDTFIGQLERAELTDEQKQRLAALLMPFLSAQPADSAAGAGAR